jgi:hypothetical protein
LNYLGYHLTRNGQAAEALVFLDQSIALGEQGYCNFGALAAAYGDISQALMELGRFEAALLAEEALPLIRTMRSRVNLERIKTLYKQLQNTSFRTNPEVGRLGYLLFHA